MSDLEVYTLGPASASVCTALPIAEATKVLNLEHPTGISSKWKWAKGEAFVGGEPNPYPCGVGKRMHYLFHC